MRKNEHQDSEIAKILSKVLNLNIPNAATFLHVEIFFDKVSHEGLTYKLIEHEITARFKSLIFTYFCNRSLRVRIRNIL